MSWNKKLADCIELETKMMNLVRNWEQSLRPKVVVLVRLKADWMVEYFNTFLLEKQNQNSQNVYDFLIRIFIKNEAHLIYLLDVKVRDTTQIPYDNIRGEKICSWEGCEAVDNLQKDHILPARSLNQNENWKNESFNVQWLCRYHNRLKTNSIGIGMAMIGMDSRFDK